MAGQSRKWMILVATVWIQAFTGTNFDFSAYSSALKSVLGISQVQLNYLAVASDMGKVFGWSSGLALMYLPLSVVLFISAFMGFVGYGFQWLVIREVISLPYSLMVLLCLVAGCSICWFNTVCFVLCIRNFPSSTRPLAISLTVSFNGVSAALYALAASALNPSSSSAPSSSLYPILNALVPALVSAAALIPILRQPPSLLLLDSPARHDSLIFLLLNLLAALTGAYLLVSSHAPSSVPSVALLSGALFLLALPLLVPGVVYARDCLRRHVGDALENGSGFLLVDVEHLELHKELLLSSASKLDGEEIDVALMGKDRLAMLGEEHSAGGLVRRLDFWLYYVAYFCGGTIGLVFSNNLGQIAQSLGQASETTTLLTLYSSFSFFGRLLSAAPDYIRSKFYFARTGWLAIALIPTPIAFFILAASGSSGALHTGTALVGLSSGFIFAAAVSVTSELFGPNSVGVNHNILVTNIPIGSLVYGLLAAMVYDANGSSGHGAGGWDYVADSVICMGRGCYFLTFVLWGCVSVVGLVSSFVLFFRTRHAYDQFEHNRTTQLY